MSQIKIWNGSAWMEPKSIKTWSGSEWIDERLGKYWTGAAWEEFITYATGSLFSFCAVSPEKVYELDVDTLAVVSSYSLEISPDGGGCMGTRIYSTDDGSNIIVELNPENMATIKSVAAFSSYPTGIGGTENQLFHGDRSTDRLYELNPDTFAEIQHTSPDWIWGVGGTKDRLFVARYGDSNYPYNRILEYNPANLAYIAYKTAPSPRGDEAEAVGGINERLYFTDCDGYDNDTYYELSLVNFSSDAVLNTVDAGSKSHKGMGGTKV